MGNNVRIVIALALAGFLGFVLLNSFIWGKDEIIIKRDGSQLLLIDDYYHPGPEEATCAALTPECGWCPGEVIDGACYAEPEVAAKYNN